MDRDEALNLLKGGRDSIKEWNRRREFGEVIPDLSGAGLKDADLGGVNLDDVILVGSDLRGANLSYADLRRANLSECDVRGADFIGVTLDGSNFSGVICGWTVFAGVTLSDVKGLDSVSHDGPSTLGIDTLFNSKGQIPDEFLRGCGVPDPVIVNRFALIGAMQPIQFYSCFISYSSIDREFADRLYADLQAKAVRCWLDHERLKIGDRIRDSIDSAIRFHDKLMVILTEHSIASTWVEGEVEAALERERSEKRTVLFPIKLDDSVDMTPIAWASHIRQTRHIGDFRGWEKHGAYQKAFVRLLKDLKAEESVGPVAPPPRASRRKKPH